MEHDKLVEQIYKKAMINRAKDDKEINARLRAKDDKEINARLKENMDTHFWKYLGSRLENMIKAVMELSQNPKIPKAKLDEAERDVSNLLDLVRMHTLPEVIEELTKNLQEEKTSIIISKAREEYVKKL